MKHDEPIMEWRGKYKSELLMVCHMDAIALHEVGAISDEEMREYDRDCLVPSARKILKNKSASVPQKPVPAYAASGSQQP